MRFLLQFNNVLVYVLLAAGFVKLMTNLRLDASPARQGPNRSSWPRACCWGLDPWDADSETPQTDP